MQDRDKERAALAIKLVATLRNGIIGMGVQNLTEAEVETIIVLTMMIANMPERPKWRLLRILTHEYAELAPEATSGTLGRPQHTQ